MSRLYMSLKEDDELNIINKKQKILFKDGIVSILETNESNLNYEIIELNNVLTDSKLDDLNNYIKDYLTFKYAGQKNCDYSLQLVVCTKKEK